MCWTLTGWRILIMLKNLGRYTPVSYNCFALLFPSNSSPFSLFKMSNLIMILISNLKNLKMGKFLAFASDYLMIWLTSDTFLYAIYATDLKTTFHFKVHQFNSSECYEGYRVHFRSYNCSYGYKHSHYISYEWHTVLCLYPHSGEFKGYMQFSSSGIHGC